MTLPRIAAFTDTYLPTVNGVTYTVDTWRDRWEAMGGKMDVVYPDSRYDPAAGEHPVHSLPLPVYEGFRLGTPRIPDAFRADDGGPDIVHAHTPFGLGLAGLRMARRLDLPFVVSYHTPTAAYAGYLSDVTPVRRLVSRFARNYEDWFLGRADAVVVPTATAATMLPKAAKPRVVSNGVDTDHFRPTEGCPVRERYGLPADRPLVGYTGRHGHEKRLERIIDAIPELDREVGVVFGGDGPARGELEALAAERDVRAHFLGFLDREELPALYSTLDAFVFPSPVETEGLAALEAIACGTPVVAAETGGLAETVDDGETGALAPGDDPVAFAGAIERVLAEQDRLHERCLDERGALAVDRSLDRLRGIYASLRSG